MFYWTLELCTWPSLAVLAWGPMCMSPSPPGVWADFSRAQDRTYKWLNRLRVTPNNMWMTPRMTDIFILKELRKVSLLVARFQICKAHTTQLMGQDPSLLQSVPWKKTGLEKGNCSIRGQR